MINPIAPTDIESELSYAFLHAVASKAGAACSIPGRLSDNRGVDAQLTHWGSRERGEVDLKVQLKATARTPADSGSHLSYALQNEHYNDLRIERAAAPRILVVLFLPNSQDEWLQITESELILQRAAYWVSLRGAADATTGTTTTVYLPKSQLLTPASLQKLFDDVAMNQMPQYLPPAVQK